MCLLPWFATKLLTTCDLVVLVPGADNTRPLRLQITLFEACTMLAYYGLFVAYIIAFERTKTTALHIEDSHQYQEARRLAQQLQASEEHEMHHSVLALATVPSSVRNHVLSSPGAAQAWPSFRRGAASHVVEDLDEDAAPVAMGPRKLGRSVTLDPRILLSGAAASGSSSEDEAQQPLMNGPSDSSEVPAASTQVVMVEGGAADEPPAQARPCTWAQQLSRALQAPILALLHLTMPAVGLADTVRYPKVYAVLLPVTGPLFVVLGKGLALRDASPLGADALLYGLVCSALSSAIIFSIYPRNGRHYGILSGVFTALAFTMAILWMDIAAGEMVRAWKSLGYIHGLSQDMLGVTVLAWANSFGDFVADVNMAKDGFPVMAVAACFASPLFTTVAGLGMTFALAVLVHGDVSFVVQLPLRVAAGFALASVLRHLILVPFVFKYQLGKWAAMSMLAFYLAFQGMYLWAIAKQGPSR
jgi:Ca2+/Na+ antiporter